MKNLSTLVGLFLIFFSLSMQAQVSLQNDVVSSGGASSSSTNLQIDYTVGEPVIETVSSTNLTLTQGFHQPGLTITSIDEPEVLGDISVYPNPTDEFINIDIPVYYTGNFSVTLADASGRIIVQQEYSSGISTIEMQNIATGTYFLQIISNDLQQKKNLKILKIK